jgi:short-subunit dehydrogenase
MKNLLDRTALVTGAAGGIGPDIARALAHEGVGLVLSGLPDETDQLEALRDELSGSGVAVALATADLRDPEQCQELCREAAAGVGPVDLLINNAGIEMTASFPEFSVDELAQMVAVNLLAPMMLVRAALPGMLARGRGHVVFMSSLAGKLGTPYNHPYAATKAGLVALTQSLRAEYGPSPVGFSAICPTFVSGAGMYARMEDAGAHAPFMATAVAPDAVAAAVIRAIRDDLPEVIVSARPVRPLLALTGIAPRLSERVLRRTGPDAVFRHMAAARGRLGSSPTP